MEHRKEKRIPEKNPVYIKSAEEIRGDNHGVGLTAYTYDISLGGARLFCGKYFAVGTVLRIVLELRRTSQVVQVDGEVKWSRHREEDGVFEMGVEFLHNISQTILTLLRHLYGMENGISTSVSAFSAEPATAPAEAAPAGSEAAASNGGNGSQAATASGPENGGGRKSRGKGKKTKPRASPSTDPQAKTTP